MNRIIGLFCVWTATKIYDANVLLIITGSSDLYHLIFKVYWFVASYLWVSNGKELCPIMLYAQNQFFMIIAYSAALAEYIEHIFYFKFMIVWLFDCLIGKKQRILVLVIYVTIQSQNLKGPKKKFSYTHPKIYILNIITHTSYLLHPNSKPI